MEEVKKQLIELQNDVMNFRLNYGNDWDDFMKDHFRKIEYRISLMKDENGMYIMAENYVHL